MIERDPAEYAELCAVATRAAAGGDLDGLGKALEAVVAWLHEAGEGMSAAHSLRALVSLGEERGHPSTAMELILTRAVQEAEREGDTEYSCFLRNDRIDLVLGPSGRLEEAAAVCHEVLARTTDPGRWGRSQKRLADIEAASVGTPWLSRYRASSLVRDERGERREMSGPLPGGARVTLTAPVDGRCLFGAASEVLMGWEQAKASGEPELAFRCGCGRAAVARGDQPGTVALRHVEEAGS